jgi:hypothetical protein
MESKYVNRVLASDFLSFCILEYKELQIKVTKKNANTEQPKLAATQNKQYFTLSKENADVEENTKSSERRSPSQIMEQIHLE